MNQIKQDLFKVGFKTCPHYLSKLKKSRKSNDGGKILY